MPVHPIGHVAICVQDLDQSVRFYRQLGLDLSYQTPDMAYFYSGNQGIALMRVGSAEAKPHFGFACTSRREVEERHRALTQQGLSVTPIQVMGNAAAFYGQDPSGNWFEYLYEPGAAVEVQPRQRGSRAKGFG